MSCITNITYIDKIQILRSSDYFVHGLGDIIQKNKIVLLFILVSWFCSAGVCERVIFALNNFANFVTILYNDPVEKKYYEKFICKQIRPNLKLRKRVDLLFCHHNTFVDENIFTIKNDSLRKYDLVINASFNKYKNTNVARLCSNTAHIGYLAQKQDIEYPSFGKIINKENEILSTDDIVDILNDSSVGGIFSPIEGGCRASSEYLLCGLPVVSIKSLGGRDIFYNNENSIICNDDPVSVKNAVEECIHKLKNGSFDRQKIRTMHIDQCNKYRNNLKEYVLNFMLKKGIEIEDTIKLKLCDDIVGPRTFK